MSYFHKRYIYETVPVSPEDAQRCKDEEITWRRAVLAEVEVELADALAAPLCTERRVQIEVLPGDPRYDQAPFALDAVQYRGAFEWVNLPPKSSSENQTETKP